MLEEVTRRGVGKKSVLEVGAGAGNTAFPILRGNENEELVMHTCDFSGNAVELIKASPECDERFIKAKLWDMASEALPPEVEEGSIDVVLLIFTFSALNPKQWAQAVRNVHRALRPGGEVCFRDYGRGDLAQVRFRKGRWMEENFYVRGDGTRVYFFDEDELRKIWGGGLGKARANEEAIAENTSKKEIDQEEQEQKEQLESQEDEPVPAFEIASLGVDRRMLVNRQKELKMYRCWMQGRFRKSALGSSHSEKG